MTRSDRPDHHCPACGTALHGTERYPWHFCADCRDTAQDGAARGLGFANTTLTGGFAFRYLDGGDWIPCRGVIALVKGRPALIHEARMGGVVAEPLTEPPVLTGDIHDLRGPDRLAPERERPRPDDRGRDPFSNG